MRIALIIAAVVVELMVGSCASQQSEDSAAALKLKSQCQEAGARTRAEWVAKYHGERFSDAPEYAYNAALNTCLYADSYTDSENPLAKLAGATNVEVRFVLDVYTNKTLVEYTAYDGKPIEGSPTEAQFEDQRRKLMGGQ